MRLTWVVLAWFNLPRWQADAVAFAKRKAIGLRLLCVARMGLIVKAFRLQPESGIAPKEDGGACH
jgi:hypothetical protein